MPSANAIKQINIGRPARDVGQTEYCKVNVRQVIRKCDRCRHRSSETAGPLARDFGQQKDHEVKWKQQSQMR